MSSSSEPRRVGVIRGATIAAPRPARPVLSPGLTDAARGVLAEAREQGRAEGYAAGHAEALAVAQREVAEAIEADRAELRRVLVALEEAAAMWRDREGTTLEAVADQAAQLGLAIAEAVLQREVATATDPGRDAIARALQLAPDEGAVVVRLHPDDVATLGDLADLTVAREVTVVPDASIQPGGCLLQCGPTQVDAQIPSAIARVREVLR